MINSFISYFLNISSTWLKLLNLVLYLIHKGQFVLCFGSIIFFKPCFTRHYFIPISIYSAIYILNLIYCLCFYLYVFLWIFKLLIIILLISRWAIRHIIIGNLIIIFFNFIITSFTHISIIFFLFTIIMGRRFFRFLLSLFSRRRWIW